MISDEGGRIVASKEPVHGIALTFDQLAKLLGLPNGVRIVGLQVDGMKYAQDVVCVRIAGEGITGAKGLECVNYTMSDLVVESYRVRLPQDSF
jgi:alkylated DNA nucleotide flippase Atl1